MLFHFYLSSIYIYWSILYDYHTEKKRKCVCYVGLSMHINYRYINSVLKLGPVCWGKWKMKWSLCWFQRSLYHWPQRNLASNHHEWPTGRSLGGRDSTIGPGLPVHRHPRRGLPCRLETWKWHCMCIVIYTCSIHKYNEYLKLFNVRVFIINNMYYTCTTFSF